MKREACMGRYAGQNIPSVALPSGVCPPGCEVSLVDTNVESDNPATGDSSDSSDDDNDNNSNFVCAGQNFLWAFSSSFSFISQAFMVFAFIATHCWRGKRFYGLFMRVGVFLGFRVCFLLFHSFPLVCFAVVSIHLQCFLWLVFVPGCLCFEPLGSSFIRGAFFFASLLLWFIASLCYGVSTSVE